MADRVPCSTPGCKHTILPETAERTGGTCMPCVHKNASVEREAYIAANRVTVDPFEGVTDVVEIIQLLHRERDYDPLRIELPYKQSTEAAYKTLTPMDADRLIRNAIMLLEKGASGKGRKDLSEKVAICLAAFTEHDRTKLLIEMANRHRYYPGLMYRAAAPVIRDMLLKTLASTSTRESLRVNHLLSALAWIGDEVVQESFNIADENAFLSKVGLHVPPSSYAQLAGWELDSSGQRRNLYFDECFALDWQATAGEMAVRTGIETNERCPWCKRTLVQLFDFDLKSHLLSFIPLVADRLEVVTCESCTCFGPVFSQLDDQVVGSWYRENKKPEYIGRREDRDEPSRLPSRNFFLTSPRKPWLVAEQFVPATTTSQVGGIPTWVQDPEFLSCPKCDETMIFLAQLDLYEMQDRQEGTYYAMICAECRIIGTTYQQT